VSNDSWRSISTTIKQFSLRTNGTLSLSEAFITGGGVSVKEIDPRTMASKLIKGLYFCGEVMDVHGYTGGYNITAAFASGHCAGRSAAQFALNETNHI
jgi:predicted flavoprotein YhiN